MHHHEEPRSRNPSVDELRFKLSFMMWLCNDFEQMGLSDSIIWEFMSVHNINTRLLYPPTYVLCAPMHSSQNLKYRTPPQFHEATWSLITNSHAPINNLGIHLAIVCHDREKPRSQAPSHDGLLLCAFERMICWITIDQLRRDVWKLAGGETRYSCLLPSWEQAGHCLSLSLSLSRQSISQR